jgi:hypothetical protein
VRRPSATPPLDLASFAQALARPGSDTRIWLSYGLVMRGDDTPVEYDDEAKQMFVNIELMPSQIPVRCRVGASFAGDGEGEWSPMVEGDEVLVFIPSGNPRGGGVIGPRLNNSKDAFPKEVIGQDATKNGFAFRRRVTPVVEEHQGPYYIRTVVGLSYALIGLDDVGNVSLRGADGEMLQLSADALMYQGPSGPGSPPRHVLQIQHSEDTFLLQVGDVYMQLSGSQATHEVNLITVPGPMAIGTATNAPQEHVLTTEAFLNILTAMLAAMPSLLMPTTLSPQPTADAGLAAIVSAAASSGTWSAFPLTQAALVAAFAAATQKAAAPAGLPQSAPGLGCAGLLAG